MGFNTVAIRRGASTDGYAVVLDAMEALRLDESEFSGRRIFIKPNAGRLVSPRTGINASPEAAAAVMDFFLGRGVPAASIVVAESPILGVKALEALEKCGIAAEARRRNIALIDLDARPPVSVELPHGRVIRTLRVCAEALDEKNYIVSVPVMKTHMHTQVSLGLKNMKGCLYGREKVKLHQLPPSPAVVPPVKPLDMAIADMAGVLLPHLTVIDGTIGQEGLGPSAGDPKEAGLALASRNCLASDTAAVRLMGFDPAGVYHLREAAAALGARDPRYDFQASPVETDPADAGGWVTAFDPPPVKISVEYDNVIVDDKDSCSACLSTVLMFLKRNYAEFADYLTPGNPLRIALGKAIGPQKENTLLVGNCTLKRSENGIFIKGCPPVASEIRKVIDRLLPGSGGDKKEKPE